MNSLSILSVGARCLGYHRLFNSFQFVQRMLNAHRYPINGSIAYSLYNRLQSGCSQGSYQNLIYLEHLASPTNLYGISSNQFDAFVKRMLLFCYGCVSVGIQWEKSLEDTWHMFAKTRETISHLLPFRLLLVSLFGFKLFLIPITIFIQNQLTDRE